MIVLDEGVNLPRWGLKLLLKKSKALKIWCKFTPLGFETFFFNNKKFTFKSVNLPRWGLKLS